MTVHYRPGLFLVYGGVGWREDHRQAAARELQEEVGITIDPDTLRLVMPTPNMHLYELRLTEKPELQIDRREIVEACFMHPDGLREAHRGGKVGEYMRRSAARLPSACSRWAPPQWRACKDAPISLKLARQLREQGKLMQALKYDGEVEVVVVKSVKAARRR